MVFRSLWDGVAPPINQVRPATLELGVAMSIAFPPPLDRLHGYNVGKYEVKLRSERLHYRLQSGYGSGYIGRAKFKRIRPTSRESALDCVRIPLKTARNRFSCSNW